MPLEVTVDKSVVGFLDLCHVDHVGFLQLGTVTAVLALSEKLFHRLAVRFLEDCRSKVALFTLGIVGFSLSLNL